MNKSITTGLIVYGLLTYLILIGIPIRLGSLAFQILSIISALLYYGLLRKNLAEATAGRATLSGLVAGLITGIFIAAMIWGFATLIANGIRVQPVFDKIVPQNLSALLGVSPGTIAKGEAPVTAYLMQVVMLAIAGIARPGGSEFSEGGAGFSASQTLGPAVMVMALTVVCGGLALALDSDDATPFDLRDRLGP